MASIDVKKCLKSNGIKINAHEPIISQELFDKAQVARKSRYRTPKHHNRALANPLAGILKCQRCEGSMRFQKTYDRPNHQLRCYYEGCKGKQKGSVFHIVEDRILKSLHEIINSFEVKEQMLPDESNTIESMLKFKRKTLKDKRSEVAELEKQKGNLHDLLEKGIYDVDTFVERQQILKKRINEAEQEVTSIEDEISHYEEQIKNQTVFVPKVKKVLEAYEQSEDIEEKNRLLKTVIEKVTYFRDVTWKEQDKFEIHIFPRL